MILGVLGQLFEPIEIEIFLKSCRPILGSKKTYLGSKIDILNLFGLRSGKYHGSIIKEMDDTGSPGQIFRAHRDGRGEWGRVYGTYFVGQV